MKIIEDVAEAIRATRLLGCDCCVYSSAYANDPCPVDEDDYKDHTYESDCWAGDRARALALAIVTEIDGRGRELVTLREHETLHAAQHMISAIAFPDDAHAGDSRDLAWEHFERLAEGVRQEASA